MQSKSALLQKESKISVLSLLKFFYDEEVFTSLIREIYNSDPEISLSAIRASAALGNELAIPHLYKILEKGRGEQKTEAIRTLAVIRAPSSITQLLKYYPLFQEKELRAEILTALVSISPEDRKVQELCKTVVQDGSVDKTLRIAASNAVIAARDVTYLTTVMKTVPEDILCNLFHKALMLDPQTSGRVFEEFVSVSKSFSPETLGYFLAGYLIFVRNADYKYLIERLTGKAKKVVKFFLSALYECPCGFANPLRVFKTLLILPYVSLETERLTGNNLEKIVELMRKESPFVLNELATITVAHLDTLFIKIKRHFLSMEGVTQREELLSVLFSRLVEQYATPALLDDLNRYFKGVRIIPEAKLIENLQLSVSQADDEEKNRMKACMQVFSTTRKGDSLRTQTLLGWVNLERPSLMRRLNRFVRLAGMLGIKTVIKNIQKILEFARTERVTYLEETSVVSLCQLYDKFTLDHAPVYFLRWKEMLPSLKGYIRGTRFCKPPVLLKDIAELLMKPELTLDLRKLAIDTIEKTDFTGVKGVLPFFQRLLFVENTSDEIRARIGGVLCQWADATIFQQMLDLISHAESCIRVIACQVIRVIAQKDPGIPREVLVNKCYTLLEDEKPSVAQEALVTLLALKDDYAIQVLGDYFLPEKRKEAPALIARLSRPFSREVLAVLFSKITTDDPEIQNKLREVLEEVAGSEQSEELRNMLLDTLHSGAKTQETGGLKPATEKQTSIIDEAKLEFKFKRENSQVLTVFFCDIVSYTEKTSIVNTSTLMKLIHSFEGIVRPVISHFKGNVVKTLGDGILAVFKHPLAAVLASINIQKHITSYNQFKTDDEKFQIRIGLNTGLVIRKQDDIFGDVVNVASRMQTTANPGDILLTHSTFDEVKAFVRCTELGRIKVKGKEEAITAYAAHELKPEHANLLKPAATKTAGGTGDGKRSGMQAESTLNQSMFTPSFDIPEELNVGKALLLELVKVFSDIAQAVEEVAKDYQEEYEFKKYLQNKWDALIKNWNKFSRDQVATVNEMLFDQRQNIGT
ncbi:MAG: hypothetical protein EHM28_06040 [Spirochaetaceae bacterium]|nr:MAG: hypothetical protein EHM28_06040 [Spirochaetaceae bacterium]